jgi:predicted lipoprotein with Yx(FWY)xxD motif
MSYRFASSRLRAITASVALVGALSIGAGVVANGVAHADTPRVAFTLQSGSTKLGTVLTDGQGMSLYMFRPDARNVSNCEAGCLVAWPPVMLAKNDSLANVATGPNIRRSLLGVALREDGSRQVTYNGWPLYWWARDVKPGDVNGQWVANVWWVMNEDGVPQLGKV